MSTVASAAAAARNELRGDVKGELIGPGDPGYDQGCTVYNAMIERRPVLIARATDGDDVAQAIALRAGTTSCSRCAEAATTAAASECAMTASCSTCRC